jgi:hypothetical protein
MRVAIVGFLTFCMSALASAQVEMSFQINSSETVHFIVTDPLGRRTGADPRGVHMDTLYRVTFLQEIPQASYVYTSIGSLDTNAPPPPESHEFNYNLEPSTDDRSFTLDVIGTKLTTFWIDAFVGRSAPKTSRSWHLSASGVVQKDSVVSYQLRCPRANTSNATLTKVVNSRSLIRDVAAMVKLHWIVTQPAADKYSNLIRNYGSQMKQANVHGAQVALISIVENIASDSSRTLTIDACKLLRPDVQYLLSQLNLAH